MRWYRPKEMLNIRLVSSAEPDLLLKTFLVLQDISFSQIGYALLVHCVVDLHDGTKFKYWKEGEMSTNFFPLVGKSLSVTVNIPKVQN